MNKKIILLADDDTDDTQMFCEALENIDNNIVCHCEVNGSDAVKKLNELDEKPKLIFLDLNMPIMNGWECLLSLKKDERYKDIPVIMISTSSHKDDIDRASDLGALCYFVKPNTFKDLTEVLEVITANLNNGLKDAILNLKSKKTTQILYLAEGR